MLQKTRTELVSSNVVLLQSFRDNGSSFFRLGLSGVVTLPVIFNFLISVLKLHKQLEKSQSCNHATFLHTVIPHNPKICLEKSKQTQTSFLLMSRLPNVYFKVCTVSLNVQQVSIIEETTDKHTNDIFNYKTNEM